MPSASPYERDGGGDAKTDMRSTKYHADESLRSDKEVVIAAVTQNGYALHYANDSLKTDLEIQLVVARNRSATFASKLVGQLSKLPHWEERDAELNREVELVAAFPDSQTAPAVNKKLHHTLVERMVKRGYPARKKV